MPRSTVQIMWDSHVREYVNTFEQAAQIAMQEAAPTVVVAVKMAETRRDTGALADSITATAAKRGSRYVGLAIEVGKDLYYWRFQEYGTLGKRRRKLKRAQARTERASAIAAAGGGIKPLRYMSRGLAGAWPSVVDRLQRQLQATFGPPL